MFAGKLLKFVENQHKILAGKLIQKPETIDEIKHNKRLYNKKSDGMVSMLRDYFKELVLTEDQHTWLGGKLWLKIGEYNFTLPIYSKEKRAKRHQQEKKEKHIYSESSRLKKEIQPIQNDPVMM